MGLGFIILDHRYARLNLSWDTTCVMEVFLKALEPFSRLTDLMSAEKEVSICGIYPLLQHIKSICDNEATLGCGAETEELRQMSKDIRTSIWNYINER